MSWISQLRIRLKFIPPKMKKSHLSVRDGIELLKQKCVSNSPYKTTQSTLTSYLKYSLLTTIANIDQ